MGTEDSPPLVFLHGFAGDKLTWQFFFQPLSKLFKLYAFDLPGHGDTRFEPVWNEWRFGDWLAETLEALGIQNPHIVAHSMGGRIALDFAAENLAASLHLLSCAGLAPHFNSHLLQALTSVENEEAMADLVRKMIGQNHKLVLPTAKAMMGKLEEPAHAAALSSIISASTQRSRPDRFTLPRFDRIQAPMYFFWGALDQIVPSPDNLPPTASYTVIERAGHMLPLEASGFVAKSIKENLIHA